MTTTKKTDPFVGRATALVERLTAEYDKAVRDRKRACLSATTDAKALATTRDALDVAEARLEAARDALKAASEPEAIAARVPKYKRLAELRPLAGVVGFNARAGAALQRAAEIVIEGVRLALAQERYADEANDALGEAKRLAGELGEQLAVEPVDMNDFFARVARAVRDTEAGFDDVFGEGRRLGAAREDRAAQAVALEAAIESRCSALEQLDHETPEMLQRRRRLTGIEMLKNNPSGCVINGKPLEQQYQLYDSVLREHELLKSRVAHDRMRRSDFVEEKHVNTFP